MAKTQQAVCFTETPIEHAWMMCRQIAEPQFPGSTAMAWPSRSRLPAAKEPTRSGTSTSRSGAVQRLTEPVNRLVDAAEALAAGDAGVTDGSVLASADILRLTPFIEQMGPKKVGRKEFWWEREWRHVGKFTFNLSNIVVAFAPENQQAKLQARLKEATDDDYNGLTFVDVNWGLERIIGALANVDAADLGPFPLPR